MEKAKKYGLFIDLDFKNLRFTGKLCVEIEADEDVALNSLGLNILGIRTAGKPLRFEQKGEELTVETGPFRGVLEIDYAASIPDALTGIYRAAYGAEYVVSTQFEASSARRMFPCIDRPDAKAEFKLTVKTDADLTVISNMPAESIKKEGDEKTVAFQATPKMSTYLLYLGVGKFEEIKTRFNETDIIVATVPGKVDKGKYGLEVAAKSLDFYQTYFGIPYTLPKLHLIAVPEFAAGAMENWGAVAFRETALLIDEGSDVRAKRRVTEVVAHELAHMWFGDLVTMRWWDNLWLNESFATLMAFKVIDHVRPEWDAWQHFLATQTAGAMSRDSIRSTHPIEVSVRSPEEIEQIFDDISYGKGASILRMLEAYMGVEDFRRGIGSYLSKYRFSNAEGSDFWNALEAAHGGEIKNVANRWIGKPGYPVITVSLNEGKLTLRQERFLLSGGVEDVWPIPVVMRLNEETVRLLFDEKEKTIDAEDLRSLKLNVDSVGFYRVYYEGIYDLVWKSSLSASDRWGIISDALAFLTAKKISFPDYLGVVRRYFGEQSYLPALEASNQLAFLCTLAQTEMMINVSREFHRQQLKVQEGKADENSVMLHGVFAGRLAMLDEGYAGELASRFEGYEAVDPNMRDAVVTAYARARGDFQALLRKYRGSGSDEERVRLLIAMMSFKDAALVAQSLEFALGGEVKRQDVGTLILASLRNPSAHSPTWTWLKANINRLKRLFEGTETLPLILTQAIPVLGVGRVEEAEEFFEENKGGVEKSVEAGLEKLKIYDSLARRIKSSA